MVANHNEVASRPLREEVASVKLLLAHVGDSLVPMEIYFLVASFLLGSAG
jgi:hypothetical protein